MNQCPNGTLSFGGSNLLSQCTCQLNATILPELGLGCTCSRGFYRNSNPSALGQFDCQPCTSGTTYCYLGTQYPCPANSLAASLSSNLTDCKCNPGFYRNTTGNLTTCPACPANSYCNSNQLFACPANTNSPVQSSLQSQCKCLGGYKCSLVQDYRLVVKFQLTLSQFNAQAATIRSQIAASAGVDVASVVIESSTPVASRRLLSATMGTSDNEEANVMEISIFVPIHHNTHTDLITVIH